MSIGFSKDVEDEPCSMCGIITKHHITFGGLSGCKSRSQPYDHQAPCGKRCLGLEASSTRYRKEEYHDDLSKPCEECKRINKEHQLILQLAGLED